MNRNKTARAVAYIDLDAVLFNINAMRQNLASDAKIVAVIKTNGYGHGAIPISEVLEPLSYVWGYAVATVDEAVQLRKAGRQKPILILGLCFEEYFEDIVRFDLRPAVCEYEMAEKLSQIAQKYKKDCRIHAVIDTGMGRIGYQVSKENARQIARIAELPNMIVEGIFTHFARADETSKEPAYRQIQLFRQMIADIEEENIFIPLKHCSNSAGILEIPESHMDLVRAGITLYGLSPSDEVSKDILSLKPVMSLKSHVSFVKDLEQNKTISYGGTYVTDALRRIATIPVGYGDGYARGLSNKGYVLIHGKKAPICGRVCMDQFMVDVTDIPDVSKGDEVTLLGRDGDLTITMEELGALSGRFNYEFACLITDRIPRVYCHEQKIL